MSEKYETCFSIFQNEWKYLGDLSQRYELTHERARVKSQRANVEKYLYILYWARQRFNAVKLAWTLSASEKEESRRLTNERINHLTCIKNGDNIAVGSSVQWFFRFVFCKSLYLRGGNAVPPRWWWCTSAKVVLSLRGGTIFFSCMMGMMLIVSFSLIE